MQYSVYFHLNKHAVLHNETFQSVLVGQFESIPFNKIDPILNKSPLCSETNKTTRLLPHKIIILFHNIFIYCLFIKYCICTKNELDS